MPRSIQAVVDAQEGHYLAKSLMDVVAESFVPAKHCHVKEYEKWNGGLCISIKSSSACKLSHCNCSQDTIRMGWNQFSTASLDKIWWSFELLNVRLSNSRSVPVSNKMNSNNNNSKNNKRNNLSRGSERLADKKNRLAFCLFSRPI